MKVKLEMAAAVSIIAFLLMLLVNLAREAKSRNLIDKGTASFPTNLND
jgi:hypothetical protein